MGLRISTNVESINAQRNLSTKRASIAQSMERLSSGSRINKASDDAAGLAISEKFRAQLRSNRQASKNANDGISMVQVAEGGLTEIANIIVRLRELAVQASSDTISDNERGFVEEEVKQLKDEMERISKVTTWGSVKLLDGSNDKFDFQIGVYNDEFEDRISFNTEESTANLDSLGMTDISLAEKSVSQESLGVLDTAQQSVSRMKANLGALQNRLVSTVANLENSYTNISAANSRIRDTDIAMETAEKAKGEILMNAGIATLAQANQTPALALKLI